MEWAPSELESADEPQLAHYGATTVSSTSPPRQEWTVLNICCHFNDKPPFASIMVAE